MAGDVDGRQKVLLDDTVGDDDAVLIVVAFPRHVGHGEVRAKCKLGLVDGRTISERFALDHVVAHMDDRTVVDARGLVGALVLRKVIALGARGSLHDDVGCVDLDDVSLMLGADELAGVEGSTELHAGADERRMRTNQRHSLALHVCTHEGTLCVIVLEERNEVCCDGEQLARRHIHVVDIGDVDLGRCAEGAVEVARTGNDTLRLDKLAGLRIGDDEAAGLGVVRRVCRCDVVVFLFVCRHPVDIVGDLAIDDAAVRSFDEAVLIHMGIEGERADEADVRAFRRLDRAHAGVVRVVDVADGRRHVRTAARARLVPCKATRAKRGQTALVREARERVILVHELGELRRAEELLDGRHDRANVDEGLRRDIVSVLRSHALAHDTLHAGEADTELVLHKLADRTDTAVAEVVDIVRLLRGIACMKGKKVAQCTDDILVRDDRGGVLGRIEAELLVHLVAADACEVVALRVEVEAIQERLCRIDGRRLARTLATVDLDESILARRCDIALDRGADDLGIAEEVDDLVVGLCDAKSTEQERRRLAALAVDGYDELAALVDLELEPGTTGRNELCMVHEHAGIGLLREVDARGADELGDDDTLGAVDDEGAPLRHDREVAHEDELFLDLAGELVDELHIDKQRSLIGDVLGAALGHRVGRIAELEIAERDFHGAGIIFDRRELCKRFSEAVRHEAVV